MKKIVFLILALAISSGSFGQQKVNFDPTFQKANQGKTRIAIPPLKELLHIMLAITKSGL